MRLHGSRRRSSQTPWWPCSRRPWRLRLLLATASLSMTRVCSLLPLALLLLSACSTAELRSQRLFVSACSLKPGIHVAAGMTEWQTEELKDAGGWTPMFIVRCPLF